MVNGFVVNMKIYMGLLSHMNYLSDDFFLSIDLGSFLWYRRLYYTKRILSYCVHWYVPVRTIRENEYIDSVYDYRYNLHV